MLIHVLNMSLVVCNPMQERCDPWIRFQPPKVTALQVLGARSNGRVQVPR